MLLLLMQTYFLPVMWSSASIAVPLQTCVKNIPVEEPSFKVYQDLDEMFAPGGNVFMLGRPDYGCMGEILSIVPENKNLEMAKIRISIAVPLEPNLDSIINLYNKEMRSESFVPGYKVAQRLGINSHLVSRITGTVFLFKGSRQCPSVSKVNIGLNLKRKQEEVPGYTKRVNETWCYSQKTVELIDLYLKRFPVLFQYIIQNSNEDDFYEEDIFIDQGPTVVPLITKFLKSLPTSQIGTQHQGSEQLSEEIVSKVEEAVEKTLELSKNRKLKTQKMKVRPRLLYLPLLHTDSLPPDPSTTTQLFDRVVNVRIGYTVPLGLRGTVIGIQAADKSQDIVYEIVFDEKFPEGLTLRSSTERCYKLPSSAFINISHDRRKDANVGAKPVAIVSPQYSKAHENSNQNHSTSGVYAPSLNPHNNHQHSRHGDRTQEESGYSQGYRNDRGFNERSRDERGYNERSRIERTNSDRARSDQGYNERRHDERGYNEARRDERGYNEARCDEQGYNEGRQTDRARDNLDWDYSDMQFRPLVPFDFEDDSPSKLENLSPLQSNKHSFQQFDQPPRPQYNSQYRSNQNAPNRSNHNTLYQSNQNAPYQSNQNAPYQSNQNAPYQSNQRAPPHRDYNRPPFHSNQNVPQQYNQQTPHHYNQRAPSEQNQRTQPYHSQRHQQQQQAFNPLSQRQQLHNQNLQPSQSSRQPQSQASIRQPHSSRDNAYNDSSHRRGLPNEAKVSATKRYPHYADSDGAQIKNESKSATVDSLLKMLDQSSVKYQTEKASKSEKNHERKIQTKSVTKDENRILLTKAVDELFTYTREHQLSPPFYEYDTVANGKVCASVLLSNGLTFKGGRVTNKTEAAESAAGVALLNLQPIFSESNDPQDNNRGIVNTNNNSKAAEPTNEPKNNPFVPIQVQRQRQTPKKFTAPKSAESPDNKDQTISHQPDKHDQEKQQQQHQHQQQQHHQQQHQHQQQQQQHQQQQKSSPGRQKSPGSSNSHKESSSHSRRSKKPCRLAAKFNTSS